MKYNYIEAMVNDIRTYLEDNYTPEELTEKLTDRDEFETDLYDTLWIEDSVTGNASGSYTFNTYKAEEYICHNLDILGEAFEEFGINNGKALERGAEYCDVTIRCYLLGAAIAQALEEIESEAEEASINE